MLYVLEFFGGAGYTLAFLLLLFWARMLLIIIIDQALKHRHTLKRDRRHRFVHPLPSHLARVMICCAAMVSPARGHQHASGDSPQSLFNSARAG